MSEDPRQRLALLDTAVDQESSPSNGNETADFRALARLPEEWEQLLSAWDEPRYRAKQIFRWMFAQGVFDPEQMTNLPQSLRERLKRLAIAELPSVELVNRASDGTRKLLIQLGAGARVECVLIPMVPKSAWDAEALDFDDELDEPSERQTRVTLCVSTQYGCAMGCTFCQSGRAGLKRGLRADEIVAQVVLAKRYLEPNERLTNLVFMGMGEPLHHYDETSRALRVLTHSDGLDLSLRRITVSTVGLVHGIEKLGRDFGGKVGLAISLHAPTDELRTPIIPINRRYPVRELMNALRRYPLPRRRRITIEYTLIAGYNDGFEQARQLSQLLRGLPVKINLIPMNTVQGTDFRGSPPERVAEFQEYLARDGYSCFVRTRRGDDVAAACGQLAFQP
jgi:23S rRNA (adenine2503-C2)-methyltransferase